MDPLVSLIVPIYGVEAYVEQCARSVLAQTYENVEFIFVNDGTLDASMDILAGVLQEYPQRKVKIVNKENAGLPMARKSGLEVATGEYIMHVDADDWIEPDAVERLVTEAHRSKLDHERLYTPRTKVKWMNRLYNDGAYGYIWCKFCKRSLYENIFVPAYNMHEDIVFSTQLIWRAGTISQLSVPLIHYRRTNGSSTTRVARSKRRVQSARNILDLYANDGPEIPAVRKSIIRKAAWNAFRYDRSLFIEYPFLKAEAPVLLKLLGV